VAIGVGSRVPRSCAADLAAEMAEHFGARGDSQKVGPRATAQVGAHAAPAILVSVRNQAGAHRVEVVRTRWPEFEVDKFHDLTPKASVRRRPEDRIN